MKKIYKLSIQDSNGDKKILEVETSNLDKYLEEYSRTRHVVDWEILSEKVKPNKNLLFG